MDAASLLNEAEKGSRKRGKIEYWLMAADDDAAKLFDELCAGWLERRGKGSAIGVAALCGAIDKGCGLSLTQNTLRAYLRDVYDFAG